MEIIAMYNLKGGVGKTTGCVNLAYAAARDGFKTLVWDLDVQGAASFFLGNPDSGVSIKKVIGGNTDLRSLILPSAYHNLHLIPADLTARNMDILLNDQNNSSAKQLKGLLKPLKGVYDFVFLDCPPGFSVLADGVFKAADIILMPVIPTTLSVRTFNIVKEYLEGQKIESDKLMCYFNMVDVRKNLHMEVMQTYARDFRFFQYYVPSSAEIEKNGYGERSYSGGTAQ